MAPLMEANWLALETPCGGTSVTRGDKGGRDEDYLSGEVGGTALRDLQDDGGLRIAGSLERSNNG